MKFALAGFLQYSSLGDAMLANVRFRYHRREGNDLYIVLNEHLDTDRYANLPHRPLTNSRTVLVKYTHTFDW